MSSLEYGVWHGSNVEYSPVPLRVICDPSLGHAAVRLYGYMIGVVTRPVSTNPSGRWVLRRRDMMKQCRVGEEGWSKAVRQLEAAGLYRGERVQLSKGATETDAATGELVRVGGQQRYIHHVFPVAEADPAAVHAAPRQATPRRGAWRQATPLTHPGLKQSKGSSSTRERVPDAAAAPSAVAKTGSGGRQFERRPSGIECWWPKDPAAAAAIEAEYSPAEISSAVTAVNERHRSPAPGVIVDEIRRQRRARAAHAASAAVRTVTYDPAAAFRGELEAISHQSEVDTP